ncbi:MAG: hypothetical protein RBT63_10015 [Bdellovibrionales bacterium]|jgi:hypothetical protein|nr:hypothetical protein [Bdellovibrionales bacterium]
MGDPTTDNPTTHDPAPTDKPRARSAPKVIALIAALLAAYAVHSYLRPNDQNDVGTPVLDASAGFTVGEIRSVEGQVLIRQPRGTKSFPAQKGPYLAESVIQTLAASAVEIEFKPGPTIRLLENSRLVTEVDPTRDRAIQAILLAGEITVLDSGQNPDFTLLQNGLPIPYQTGPIARTVPLIELGSPSDETIKENEDSVGAEDVSETESSALLQDLQEESSEHFVPPSVSLEDLDSATAKQTPPPDSRPKTLPPRIARDRGGNLLRSTLTNDDIRSQVRAQAGSFQRCYVAMVNRASERVSEHTPGTATGRSEKNETAALPRGTFYVSFKIQPIGKVDDPRVMKSPFNDRVFDRCAADALARLRFRSFQGAAIPVTDFPITLE